MILEILLLPADDLTVQPLYPTINSRRRLAGTAEFFQCTVRFYNVQSGPTVLSSADAGGIFHLRSYLKARNLYLKARSS